MRSLISIFLGAALLFMQGCKFTAPPQDTSKLTDGENQPRPPSWARINAKGIRIAIDIDSTEISGVNDIPAIEGDLTEHPALYFAGANTVEISAALSRKDGAISAVAPIVDLPAAEDGQLIGQSKLRFVGEAMVVSLRKPLSENRLPLSTSDLLDCTAMIFLGGDLDRNGTVDETDKEIFVETRWATAVPEGESNWTYGDYNANGFVEIGDLARLGANWGKMISPWPRSNCGF